MLTLQKLCLEYAVKMVFVGILLLDSACGMDAEHDNMINQTIESPTIDFSDHSQSRLQCFCMGDCGQSVCCQLSFPGAPSGVCVPRNTVGLCSPPGSFPPECSANN
jgi:hypothetical protein